MEKNVKKNVYMYNWITLRYSRDWDNTANQLFFYKFLSDWINAICSNIDEPRDIILSKPDRERQISLDITYMYNIKNDTNELIMFMNIKPKYTHRHKE